MQEQRVDDSANEIYEKAKAIVVMEKDASVALIQRRLKLGYSATLSIMNRLEVEGVITPLGPSGFTQLTSPYSNKSASLLPMNPNLASMLEKFEGCEGGDPGSATAPAIWVFGVEPGWSKFDQKSTEAPTNPLDDGYSVETQLQWIYNRNAFKLLAAIDGVPVSQYREFANRHQPFVQGSKGYFKGNLYPYACNNISIWPEDAATETGLASKAEYQQWCAQHRWPVIKNWIDEYQPKLFIGVGNSFRNQYALAVLGRKGPFDCQEILVNGYKKRIYLAQEENRKLAVIPHLSGGSNGLNSDEATQRVGEILREFLRR
jgi:hypothetical protein